MSTPGINYAGILSITVALGLPARYRLAEFEYAEFHIGMIRFEIE